MEIIQLMTNQAIPYQDANSALVSCMRLSDPLMAYRSAHPIWRLPRECPFLIYVYLRSPKTKAYVVLSKFTEVNYEVLQ